MTGAPAAEPSSVGAVTRRLLKRARPYAGRILVTFVVVLAACGAKTAQAWLITPVVDRLGRPGAPASGGAFARFLGADQWDVTTIAVLAVGFSVAMFLFGFLRDYLTNWLTNRVVADLRNDVAEHLAYLPLGYHYDRKAGDLVSRVTNDVNVTESATNFLFDDSIIHPVMIACAATGAFLANWKMALGAVVVFPLYALVLGRLGRRIRRARRSSLEHLGDMTGTMIQTFAGIKVVKAFGMEAEQIREFRGHNENFFRRYMASLLQKAVGENLGSLFLGFGVAVLLVGGASMLASGAITVGQLTFFALALAMINSSVRELSKSYNRLVEAAAGAERVFQVLDETRETERDGGQELERVDDVAFRDVAFAYNGVAVLRGVSLDARAGETVAVVGRTGAGKTTLLDLLCRFYDPQQGAVTVNGVDVRRLRRASLLSHVAVVTQETFLFDATIGENIRYGRRDSTAEDVRRAARAANLHDSIDGLEQGYDTPVGERGTKLSGGEKQRVAIARAILRDPAILILDEATNALDAGSERAVQDALQNLLRSGRRITFVVAHRLSTVKSADRIAVIEDGRVAEEGRHEDLVARGGAYAALYREFADEPASKETA